MTTAMDRSKSVKKHLQGVGLISGREVDFFLSSSEGLVQDSCLLCSSGVK